MAELNFNALIPEGPRGFYQGFEQGQDQRIARETNQIKLDELKRDRDEMIQLRERLKSLGQDPDPAKFLDALAQTGNPEHVKMAIEGKQKIKDLEAYAKLGVIEPVNAAPAMSTASVAPAAPVNAMIPSRQGAPALATGNALTPVTPAAPAAPANALAPQPGAEQAARAQQRIDQLLMFARTNPRMANQAMAEAKILQDQLEMFSRMKAPAPNRLADRFVPVGKNVFDREQQKWLAGPGGAGGEGSKGAPTPKPMTQVQSAARRDKLGKEFKSAQTALQTTQDVLDSIAFVKNEPGLSRATGFTGTLLPSIPEGAAASAETRLKNLEGKVTALGKAQAAASGAIGSIANQEWKILADQIAAIDRSKGTGPLLGQLELVEAQAQGAMERIKDAYQRQFGEDFEQFPQFADLPAPNSTFKPKEAAGGKPAAGGATGGWSVVR